MDYETPDLSNEMDYEATYYQHAGFSCTDDRINPKVQQSRRGEPGEEQRPDADVYGKRHVGAGMDEDCSYVYTGSNCKVIAFESSEEAQAAEKALLQHIKSNVPAQLVTDDYGKQCELSELLPTQLARLQAKLWREVPRVEASRFTFDQSADCTRHDMLSVDTVARIGDDLAYGHIFVLSTRQPQSCSFELCSLLHDTFQLPYESDQISVEPMFDLSTLTPTHDYDKFEGRILVFRRDRYKYMEYGQPLKKYFPKPLKTFCPECLAYLWNKRVHVWGIIDGCEMMGENELQEPDPAQASAVAESRGDSQAWSSDNTDIANRLLDAGPSEESDGGGTSVVSLTHSEDGHLLDCLESIAQDPDTVETDLLQIGDLPHVQGIRHRHPGLLELGVRASQEATDDGNAARLPFLRLDGADDMNDHEGALSIQDDRDSMRGSEARPAKPAIRTSEPKLLRSISGTILAQGETGAATTAAQSTMLSFWATTHPKPPLLSNAPGQHFQSAMEVDHAEEEVTWHEFLQAQAISTNLKNAQSDFDKKSHHDLYKGMRINAPIQQPNSMEIHGLVFPMPPTVDLGPVYLNRPRTKPLDEKEGHIKREDMLSKANEAGAARKYQKRATEQQTIDYWLSSGDPVTVGTKSVSVPSRLRDVSVNVRKPLAQGLLVQGSVKPSTSLVKWQKTGSPLRQLFSLFTPHSSPVKPMVQESPPGASKYLVGEEAEDEQTRPMTKTNANSNSSSSDFLKKFRKPIFCYCRKPDDGKKMVQCSNPDCNYGWFHYACLSKPEKLSCTSKTRQWTCQVCKLYKVAQTAPSSIDFHFPFLKEEILDALAVPGPNEAVPRNPYGLGLHDPYGIGLPEQSKSSESEDGECDEEYDCDEQYEGDDMDGTGEVVTDEESRDSGYYGGDEVMKYGS